MAHDTEPRHGDDLGIGARVTEENRTRFLNPDGSFNVHRKGVFERGSFSPYHAVLSASWPKFYAQIMGLYAALNVLFAFVYFACGPAGFPAIAGEGVLARFGELFYYSIQVTTLAHGAIEPATLLTKLLVSVEAILGLLAFAIGAALIMARFSNPATRILFSKRAVIGPYHGENTAFMVRVVNKRNSDLVEARAVITVALENDRGRREFHNLPLERETVYLFPLSWTVVHPITPTSPLYGLTAEDLARRRAEIVVAISAVDQDLSKTVYARRSYIAGEIAVGVKFRNILERTKDGTIVIDPNRIHEIEEAA